MSLICCLGLSLILKGLRNQTLALLLAWALPTGAVLANTPRNDRSQRTYAHDYGAKILDMLEARAIVIAQGDNVIFPMTYLHRAEERRPAGCRARA